MLQEISSEKLCCMSNNVTFRLLPLYQHTLLNATKKKWVQTTTDCCDLVVLCGGELRIEFFNYGFTYAYPVSIEY